MTLEGQPLFLTKLVENPTFRDVNSLYIDSAVTVDRCWIFDSLTTVHQRFINGLSTVYRLTVKKNCILLKLIKKIDIVVDEYLLFGRYSKEIQSLDSIN